jgi:hypothetical protein
LVISEIKNFGIKTNFKSRILEIEDFGTRATCLDWLEAGHNTDGD